MCNSESNMAETDLGLTASGDSCACCSTSNADVAKETISDSAVQGQYLVDGMTCGHCVSSVTEEVSALAGVESVSVDLNAGGSSRVTVVSSQPIPEDVIREAITEAGYALVSA